MTSTRSAWSHRPPVASASTTPSPGPIVASSPGATGSGPASEALSSAVRQVKDGVVITQIDGRALRGDSSLAESINAYKPGDTIRLTILRGDQQLSLPVTLGQLPAPTG